MQNFEAWLALGLLLVMFGGFSFAYRYGHKTKKFRLREYVAIIVWPIVAVIILALVYGGKILSLYCVSALFGFFAEYGFGFLYEKVLNSKLWTYHRLSVGGYTSLLSIPVWGAAGVIFWVLSKVVGL